MQETADKKRIKILEYAKFIAEGYLELIHANIEFERWLGSLRELAEEAENADALEAIKRVEQQHDQMMSAVTERFNHERN